MVMEVGGWRNWLAMMLKKMAEVIVGVVNVVVVLWAVVIWWRKNGDGFN